MATKYDWHNDSKLEWIEIGLFHLTKAMNFYNIPSIALPAVGCGKGNLPWPVVEQMIKDSFLHDQQARKIEVYTPL